MKKSIKIIILIVVLLGLLALGVYFWELSNNEVKKIGNSLEKYSSENTSNEENVGLYTDENMAVFDFYGKYFIVYTFNQDIVDGYYYYYDMEKENISDEKYKDLKEKYLEIDNVIDVKKEGKYMIISYALDGLAGTTRSDIEAANSYLEKIVLK